MEFEERVKNLPDAPGVYIFKGASGQVIYVGKAKSLRHRVRSYCHLGGDPKTRAILCHLADIDYIITSTEVDALMLENNLIKEHRPRYNVLLRDDKNYPCLKLTVNERFPCLYIVRGMKKDGALYFGPFTSSLALRETLRVLYKVFGLRRCPQSELRRGRACIYYQMRQCLAPCEQRIDEKEYRGVVNQIVDFFRGRGGELVARLKKEMLEEADRENFERAALLRDQIQALEKVLTRQRMVSSNFLDQDFIGLYSQGRMAHIEVLFVRSGKLIGSQSLSMDNRQGAGDEEIIDTFLKQFYGKERFIPEEIIIPVPLEDCQSIETWLSQRTGRRVKLICPQRGDRAKILEMAIKNAQSTALQARERKVLAEEVLLQLKERLNLKNLPRRIEAYDISNIQGKAPVGSRVSFQDGRPFKSGYRHYKIRVMEEPNDYMMLYEVISRRFSRALREGERLPDLVLIDGGRGQLSVGLQVLKDLDIGGIDMIALAKGREEGEEDKVYLPGEKEPITLPEGSPPLLLLQRIRDESHRFAITFHRRLRKMGALRSALEDIPGIGRVKRRELLRNLGSLRRVMEASTEELMAVPKITRRDAEAICRYFHKGVF